MSDKANKPMPLNWFIDYGDGYVTWNFHKIIEDFGDKYPIQMPVGINKYYHAALLGEIDRLRNKNNNGDKE